jgi:hypothetical protein
MHAAPHPRMLVYSAELVVAGQACRRGAKHTCDCINCQHSAYAQNLSFQQASDKPPTPFYSRKKQTHLSADRIGASHRQLLFSCKRSPQHASYFISNMFQKRLSVVSPLTRPVRWRQGRLCTIEVRPQTHFESHRCEGVASGTLEWCT